MSRIDELKRNNPEPEVSEGVDYKKMNEYLVQEANLVTEETVIGVISGIVEVGKQKQQDASYEFDGTPEDEAQIMRDMPGTYFETDADGKRRKRFPRKPVDAVIMTIDLPEVIVDKGQFYGDPNPAPMRLSMNGNFWNKDLKLMTTGNPYFCTLRKNDITNNKWSMLPQSTLYKIAVATKTITKGDPLVPQNLIDLVGKAGLFTVQVYFNGDFYTERIKFAGGLMRGQVVPKYDDNLLYYVGWNSNNDDRSIQYLTNPIINRMKMSPEWDNSKVKHQVEKIKGEQRPLSQNQSSEPDGPPPNMGNSQPAGERTDVPPMTEEDMSDLPF